MKRLWNMSQKTKVILCSIFVLVLIVEPNLSLMSPWFTSQKAYGEASVISQENAAAEEEPAAAEEPAAEVPTEEPVAEEQEPVVDEVPASEEDSSAVETPAKETTSEDEQVIEADGTATPEVTSPETAPDTDTTKTTETTTEKATQTPVETNTQDELAPQAAQNVMVQYNNNPVTAASGTFTFDTTTMTVKVGGTAYAGSDNFFPAEAGQTVELTFADIPADSVVTIAKSTSDITVTPDAESKGSCTFTMDSSISRLDISIATQPSFQVIQNNNPVTAASGTFTFDAGVTMTATVDGTAFSGSTDSIPAAYGKDVVLTFANIPAGCSVTVDTAVGSKTIKSTDTDKTFSFNMGETVQQVSVSVKQQSFGVTQNNNPVTAASGTFTFDAGVTMTATVDGTAFSGNTDYVPATTDQTVKLTFDNIPAGTNVTIDKSGGSKTIKSTDTDKTLTFTMDETIGTVNVSVNSSVTLSLNASSSQYTSTFKTEFATFMYRVDGGAWTDLADGISSGAVVEKQSAGQYTYVMPAGTIDIKAIQPYDLTTGKYTTNKGVGFMMEYTTPEGTIEQPYPEDFNEAAGLEIDGYSAASLYSFNFFPPFWSLIWSTTPNSVITADEVLKNGTFLVIGYQNNPAIDAGMSHQATDGTEGYMMVTDPVGEITASFTPTRGYQILSSTIKDTQGNAISVAADVNNVCTFTFNIANNKNMHVCSAFVTVPDTAETTSTDLTGVTISDTAGTQAAIDSGNLNLTVTDATETETVAAAAEETVGGGTAVATFDVNLDQYWNQASTTAAWTNNLTETSTPVTFSMELADNLQLADGETYQVVREHEGTSEVVDSTYDSATNTVTVSSNEFSQFTLVKSAKEPTATGTTTNTGSTGTTATVSKTALTSSVPKTSDPFPSMPLAVLVVGGLVIGSIGFERRNRTHRNGGSR